VSRFCAADSSVFEAFLAKREPSEGSSAYARERQIGLALTLTKQALTAGSIDTDPPAGRCYFGQSEKPLIAIAHSQSRDVGHLH
jgi:hypothetical protein